MIDKLYEDYGKLMVQLEILNGRINETKAKIAQELNKPQVQEEEKKV